MPLIITYPGILPSLNDPATFNTRALEFFAWVTGSGSNQLLGQLADINPNAFFPVQSSDIDTTSGRVMLTGAFGLGSLALRVMGDADILRQSGTGWRQGDNDTNMPTNDQYVLLHVDRSSTTATQTAHNITTGDLYIRHYNGGTWSAWKRLLSTSDVQSSPSDTTSGALLIEGAFGLGLNSGIDIDNLDTHVTSGFYWGYDGAAALATPGASPFPTSTGLFGLLSGNTSTTGDDDYLWQLAARFGTNELRYRTKDPSGWEEWETILQYSNIIGTVSEYEGDPVGDLFEKGNNSNGEYVRLADGTQICTHVTMSAPAGTTTWTYPAAFASIDSAAVTPRATFAHMSVIDSLGTSNLEFSNYDTNDSRQSAITQLIAIGRWFT